MLMKEDPAWSDPNPWNRPRPQTAQWALSQEIFPGVVFEKNDPIVEGHIRLMQTCTREDIPADTGWLHHAECGITTPGLSLTFIFGQVSRLGRSQPSPGT